jgi:1,4-alpha-glucan branching enzyme
MKKILLSIFTLVFMTNLMLAVNVTFQVDMSSVSGFTVANVNGTFNGWCGACAPMTDANNDGIWELTIDLAAGSYEYKFTADGWNQQENLAAGSPCTITTSGFTNRTLTVVATDIVQPVVCWSSCSNCSTVFPVTFVVDMNDVSSAFTTPTINGSFNGWSGTANPLTDANNDGVWETTLIMSTGAYEFKYAADNWGIQESLTPGLPCTVTNSGFTNRTLTVGSSAIVMDTVCYNACVGCNTVIPTYNVTFQVDMTNVTGFTTPEVNGTFNGWCGNCTQMSDANNDDIWTVTVPLQAGSYAYKYSADAWSIQEELAGLPGGCTATVGGFTNRTLTVAGDMTIPVVCYQNCNSCATAQYNVTFQVDMNNETGFTTPEVNGTFAGWCGNCIQMADADNDGVWAVTVPLTVGSYEYKYSHDNWGGQESLTSGTSCTVTNFGNTNRALTVSGNTTLPVVCYGSCSSCVVPTYNVTFQVDMSQYAFAYTTPEVNGSFAGWCGNCIQMTDANNDEVWTVTVPLPAGSYEYKFSHDNWGGQENLVAGTSCTVSNFGFTNRVLNVTGDATLPVVCYGSCNSCTAPTYNVTFQVDMSQVTGFTTPEVNGSFAGWCGNCIQMTDANNDDIWTVTVPLESGTYEFKYSADSWGIQETLAPGSSCTVTNFGFTNRSLTVGTSNIVMPVVCYGLCTICGPSNDHPSNASMVPGANAWYPQCSLYSGSCSTANNSSESGAFSGPDVWYRFVADLANVSIQLNHSGMDGAIQLLDASFNAVSGGTENASSATSGTETLNFSGLTVGQVYYVSVGAASGSGGDYSLCIKQLLPSGCATNTTSPLSICSTFKAKSTGAATYTTTFSPMLGSIGGGSITASGSFNLGNPALGLVPGNTYLVIVNANYTNLQNAMGDDVDITVFGANPGCIVTIAPQLDIQVRASQRCAAPATLVPYTYLRAEPFSCGVTNYTFEFTPVVSCNDATPTGITFTATHPSRIMSLTMPNGTSPAGQVIQPQTYYSVRIRPNYSTGGVNQGTFGTPQTIFVGGSVIESTEPMVAQNMDAEKIDGVDLNAVVYPNPNNGQNFIINADELENALVQIQIIDNMGRMVTSQSFAVDGSLNTTIELQQPLAAGMYTIQILDGQHRRNTKMIVE